MNKRKMDLALNLLISILGVAITIFPAYDLVVKHKKFTTETGVPLLLGLLLIVFSIIKAFRDFHKEKTVSANEKKLRDQTTILTSQVVDLSDQMNRDSARDAEFQKKLFEQFKITRDSLTNEPVYGIKQRKLSDEQLSNILRKIPSTETTIAIMIPTNDAESEALGNHLLDLLRAKGYTRVSKELISGSTGGYDSISAYLEASGKVNIKIHPAKNVIQ